MVKWTRSTAASDLSNDAPGPLAGMRLAGHQQHAKLVAHAVDRHDGAVVHGGQLAVDRRGLDLDDVRSAMRDRHGDAEIGADIHGAPLDHLAITPHGDVGRARRGALVVDAECDGLRLSDNAEARRIGEDDAAVAFVGASGDQRMQRRRHAERGSIGGHVMDAAIGDHDRAGHAIRRHVRQGGGEGREQPGAVGLAVGLAGLGDAHLKARNTIEPLDQGGAHRLGLRGAVAEFLARALVDDDRGDRWNRLAILARDRRIGERQHHQRQRNRAYQRATAAREQQHRRQQGGHGERGPHHVFGHDRSE